MSYIDERILEATVPNHMMVPKDILEQLVLDKEQNEKYLRWGMIALGTGSVLFILWLVYLHNQNEKRASENVEIEDHLTFLIPQVSNIIQKINTIENGKLSRADAGSEGTKNEIESDVQPKRDAGNSTANGAKGNKTG